MELLNFGCLLSPVDLRDFKVRATSQPLPENFELDFSKISVKNQGAVGSCVAHAMSTILEYHANGQHELSTNFIYGIRKELYNQEGQGMYLRDACKIATGYGDPLETDCPGNNEVPEVYEIASNTMKNQTAMDIASKFRTKSYFSCKTVEDIKYALVNYGPVIISIKWFDDYRVVNGILTGGKSKNYGYHALVCYGYTPKGFLIQNSWSKSWGNRGRFLLPYGTKIQEARGLVDFKNDEYIPPRKPQGILGLLYKALNTWINFVRKIFKI